MKNIFILLILFSFGRINAQTDAKAEVKKTIETFFEGFHKQDSTIMKSVIHKDLQLQSIGKSRDGVVQLSSAKASDFLIGIVSIPKSQKFEEKILSYNIQIDGDMANAWTEYEFWFNNKLSHCGVNSFQLIKEKNTWQIFYMVDTRRRDGCGQ